MSKATRNPGLSFGAPWNRNLRLITMIIAVVCLGLTASLWPVIQAQGPGSMHFWGGLLPVMIVISCAVFAVKGYRLEGRELVVERLMWVNRFPLQTLQWFQPSPRLIRQSGSLLGNSGFFGFMGLFKHARTGVFRALVTDPDRVVLLGFTKRSLAISPSDPERFLDAIGAAQPSAERRPEAGPNAIDSP